MDGMVYPMKPLIFNVRFGVDEETSNTITWVFSPNILPTYFVRESLFSLALAIGKPLHLETATLHKTWPNYVRVKVQINLATELPKFVRIVIVDEDKGENYTINMRIQYDSQPKYWKVRKLQGHNEKGVEN